MNIQREVLGTMPDGREVDLFTLKNDNGMWIQVTNYGAKLVSAWVPDRKGVVDNVVLGYTCLEHYLKGHPYLGATVGRVANRIGNARFNIDGRIIQVTKNHGDHHLHGGDRGFDSILWDFVELHNGLNPWVELQLTSPHGDEGYPGTLSAKVRYALLEDNSIEVKMSAVADRATVVNMTNHAYFNLNGSISNDIYKHKVKFFASNYLKVDIDSIPTGVIQSVIGSVTDFRQPEEIGKGINQNTEPVLSTLGYDQFFVTDNYQKGTINKMGEVYEPESGRVLQVLSSLPGMQFYTSNFLNTEYPVGNGRVYGKHSAFCIEPSYFPDAPNHENFQSFGLNVGETYNETIVFKFMVR